MTSSTMGNIFFDEQQHNSDFPLTLNNLYSVDYKPKQCVCRSYSCKVVLMQALSLDCKGFGVRIVFLYCVGWHEIIVLVGFLFH